MAKFIIHGKKTLSGKIAVAGAKNHALKLIPSAILSEQPCVIKNIPLIEDVKLMLEIFEALGGKVDQISDHTFRLHGKTVNSTTIPEHLAKKLRASIMFIGPLLARFGEARFPHPGGCVIGKRPIDIFLDGFEQMGVNIETTDSSYRLRCKKKRPQGAHIIFRRISVTGTENLLMAASMAEGTTELIFSAMEPEVKALAQFLNKRGARIKGAGTTHITIEGASKLRGGETSCIPDRIETGTFAILAAATNSALTITNCDPSMLEVFWLHLKKMGVNLTINEREVVIKPTKKRLQALSEVIIHEYPGLATDLQAPLTVLLTQSQGISLVHETIYEGRLLYTDNLNKICANIIMCDPHRIVIQGKTPLFGGKISSPDIRAGIALLIAALTAQGKSEIDNIYQINRGYQNIVERLRAVGADIRQTE